MTRMNADKAILDSDLSQQVIGAFYSVYNELGYGFLEGIYENAMAIALQELGLRVERQVPWGVAFRGQIVGEYRTDLIVDQRLILEIKAGSGISPAHEAQLLNYLKVTGLQSGLVLNFGPKAEFRRKVFSLKNPRSSA